MAAVRSFRGQTELIMVAAVECVVCVLQETLGHTDREDTGVRTACTSVY